MRNGVGCPAAAGRGGAEGEIAENVSPPAKFFDYNNNNNINEMCERRPRARWRRRRRLRYFPPPPPRAETARNARWSPASVGYRRDCRGPGNARAGIFAPADGGRVEPGRKSSPPIRTRSPSASLHKYPRIIRYYTVLLARDRGYYTLRPRLVREF